jgi:flagellar hook-associated protein 3 FlgL
MRITSANAFETSVSNLQKRQQALSAAQEQLTSGKLVLKPSDDPAAAAAAERALAAISRSDAQQRALAASKNSMQMTESALGDAGDLLQQARELVLSAGNGSYTDAERQTIADSLRGLRDQLLAVANRGDGSGRYLFGGQGADSPPLLDTPTGVIYNAAAGQALAASGESSPLSIDGNAVWLQAQAPDPLHPGSMTSVPVFGVLDKTISDLDPRQRTAATPSLSQTVADGLGNIDAVSANLASARARAGEALNRIDAIGQRLGEGKLDAQRQRSEAEDLDMVQAISDFQSRQSGYDAALKTYSIVQKMSLFDYLR